MFLTSIFYYFLYLTIEVTKNDLKNYLQILLINYQNF